MVPSAVLDHLSQNMYSKYSKPLELVYTFRNTIRDCTKLKLVAK